MKYEIELPTDLRNRKMHEKQRKKRDFSDYDVWNTDWYLLTLIPNMIDRLCEIRHSYSLCLWMYETGEERTDLTAEEYETELRKVAAKFRECLETNSIAEAEQATNTRFRCFEWLGHNCGTLWD